MASNPKGRSTARRQKQSRTIDLEANPVESEDASAVADGENAAEAADTAASTPDASNVEASTSGEQPDGSGSEDREEMHQEPSPAAATERRGGTSVAALLVSGLLGGVVALGGAGALNSTGNLQGVPLIGGLFGADTQTSSALEDANARIADLSARLDQIASDGGSGADAAVSELGSRIAAMEAQIAEVATGANAQSEEIASRALAAAEAASQKVEETAAQMTEVNDRIIESAGGGTIDVEALKSALSGEAQALTGRIEALENQVGDNAGSAVTAALKTDLEGIKEQIAALQGVGESVAGIDGKVSELTGQLGETNEMIAAMDTRLGALESSVNENILPSMSEVEKAASAAIESQKVARSVSARALGAVLEQGGRFSSELASAEALVGNSAAIEGLKSLAESGIMTQSDLLAGFDGVANRILSAEAGEAAGDGILDKFMASARSLVQVRPAGPVAGESTAAVLSRIEAGLKQGDLQAAAGEWDGLNEAAKAASGEWAKSLQDRITARGLIETVIGELSAGQNGEG